MRSPPPPGLVCLTTRPQETWIGTRVWHPMTQADGVPYWRECDVPARLRLPDEEPSEAWRYDVGGVEDVWPDPLGGFRCRFRTGPESTLVYGVYNLWVQAHASAGSEDP